MPIDLAFTYLAKLSRTRRHNPIDVRVRTLGRFDLRDLDGERVETRWLADPQHVRGTARPEYRGRLVVDGMVYRPLRGASAAMALSEFQRLMNADGPAKARLLGRPVGDLWWRDPYGLEPGEGLDCPLGYPTLPAELAVGNRHDFLVDHADEPSASIGAYAQVRVRIALKGGHVHVADAEPVWVVARSPSGRGISVSLKFDPRRSPAYRSFAFAKLEEALVYARQHPGFDGLEPREPDGLGLGARSDFVAIARELLHLLPSLRQAAAMLGDADADGASCYDTISSHVEQDPALDEVRAGPLIAAATTLAATWKGRLTPDYLTASQYTRLRGIHRRWIFESGGSFDPDDLEALLDL